MVGLCACGTAPSRDRLSLSRRQSGLVGRVLESGHAAGEPIVAERERARRAMAHPGRHHNRNRGNEPPGASVGVSQWQAGTPSGQVLMGADHARRIANLEDGDDAVTAGDVAARASRGVAGAAG